MTPPPLHPSLHHRHIPLSSVVPEMGREQHDYYPTVSVSCGQTFFVMLEKRSGYLGVRAAPGMSDQYFLVVLTVVEIRKDQKLVGRFLENQTFCRFLIAVLLKVYSKFGQPKWILVSQMLKLVGKWLMAICYF